MFQRISIEARVSQYNIQNWTQKKGRQENPEYGPKTDNSSSDIVGIGKNAKKTNG